MSEQPAAEPELETVDNTQFSTAIKNLVDEAEHFRLKQMKDYSFRGHMSFSLGLLFILTGSAIFGWFFFYKFQIIPGLLGLAVGCFASYLLHIYKQQPLKTYERHHKEVFMPKLAHALGKFEYRPSSGIKLGLLQPSRILPSFENYMAEDCFVGKYKGIKVILSEARMTHRKAKDRYVFDGIFVLLELPDTRFQGHTIITADRHAAARWKPKRWKDLQEIPIADHDLAGFFKIFTSNAAEAKNLAREEVLRKLEELSAEFNNAHLSLSFYKGKYVFIMIPYDVDMFEPSNLYLPITTNENALQAKKEIEQILAIIDLISLYRKPKTGNPDT